MTKEQAKMIVEMSLGCACDNCPYGNTECYKEDDCGGGIVRRARDMLVGAYDEAQRYQV